MPIYEYRCRHCDHCFETVILGGSDEDPRCPKCDASEVERLLSAFSCGSSVQGSTSSAASTCGSGGFT